MLRGDEQGGVGGRKMRFFSTCLHSRIHLLFFTQAMKFYMKSCIHTYKLTTALGGSLPVPREMALA